MEKTFDLRVILAALTGEVMYEEEQGVNELIEFVIDDFRVNGDKRWEHLPVVVETIIDDYPELAQVVATYADNPEVDYQEWVSEQISEFGDSLPVSSRIVRPIIIEKEEVLQDIYEAVELALKDNLDEIIEEFGMLHGADESDVIDYKVIFTFLCNVAYKEARRIELTDLESKMKALTTPAAMEHIEFAVNDIHLFSGAGVLLDEIEMPYPAIAHFDEDSLFLYLLENNEEITKKAMLLELNPYNKELTIIF